MLSHCIAIVAERMVSTPESEAVRWFALWHILPRLLVPQEALKRAGVSALPTTPAHRRTLHSQEEARCLQESQCSIP